MTLTVAAHRESIGLTDGLLSVDGEWRPWIYSNPIWVQ